MRDKKMKKGYVRKRMEENSQSLEEKLGEETTERK